MWCCPLLGTENKAPQKHSPAGISLPVHYSPVTANNLGTIRLKNVLSHLFLTIQCGNAYKIHKGIHSNLNA